MWGYYYNTKCAWAEVFKWLNFKLVAEVWKSIADVTMSRSWEGN